MFEPKKILVIATRRIGDVLLTTPLIRSLKQAYPDSQIDVVVYRKTASILSGNSDCGQLLEVEESSGFSKTWDFLKSIFRKYDIAISTQGGDRAYLMLLAASSKRYGLIGDSLKKSWWKRLSSKFVLLDNLNTHTVTQNLKLLELLGIQVIPNVIPPRATALKINIDLSRPYVVLHPFPMFRYKEWLLNNWIVLSRHLISEGYQILLSGGPSETEVKLCNDLKRQISEEADDVLVLAGQIDFDELAIILEKAAFYVGPDTVVTHLAAAVGCKTVALFGPSNPVKWGPWPAKQGLAKSPWVLLGPNGIQTEKNVVILQEVMPCVPCMDEGCDKNLQSESKCLKSMSPERVLGSLADMNAFTPKV